jgi:hypothetical protein
VVLVGFPLHLTAAILRFHSTLPVFLHYKGKKWLIM